MPQLDLVTFLPQYVWLLITFFGFYFFIVKYFLPRMVRVYILRTKIMKSEETQKKPTSTKNSPNILAEADELYAKACTVGKKKCIEYVTNIPVWRDNTLDVITKKHFVPYYSHYLNAIALSTFSKGFAVSTLSTVNLENKLKTNSSDYLRIQSISNKLIAFFRNNQKNVHLSNTRKGQFLNDLLNRLKVSSRKQSSLTEKISSTEETKDLKVDSANSKKKAAGKSSKSSKSTGSKKKAS